MILEPIVSRNLPSCVTLGNHDAEQDLTCKEIAEIVTSYGYTLNTMKSGELDDIALELFLHKHLKISVMPYCIYSHDYSTIEGLAATVS